jgi:hypothetical protein
MTTRCYSYGWYKIVLLEPINVSIGFREIGLRWRVTFTRKVSGELRFHVENPIGFGKIVHCRVKHIEYSLAEESGKESNAPQRVVQRLSLLIFASYWADLMSNGSIHNLSVYLQ